jgi:toxin-antitoxin system PIN domain toxin
MTWLLDGNVLAALMINTHLHHRAARRWLDAHSEPFATCAISQGTLLRVHMTMAADHSAAAAWRTLAAVEAHPRHVFWGDGFGYRHVPHRHLQGAKQVTDAWLAHVARRRKGKVATFDPAFALLHDDVVVAIPA